MCSSDLAWQPSEDGRHFLMLSPSLRKSLGKTFGDQVVVRFRVVDDAKVVIEDELSAALRTNAQASAMWKSLTAGKQRSLNQLVASAKLQSTRLKRASELVDVIAKGLDPMARKNQRNTPGIACNVANS